MKKFIENIKRSSKGRKSSGHRLNETPSSSSGPSTSEAGRKNPGDKQKSKAPGELHAGPLIDARIHMAAVSSQNKASTSGPGKEEITSKVLFKCPAISGNYALTKSQWKEKIEKHLSEVKVVDRVLSSILTIKSLNPPAAAQECINILIIYLKNLIEFPENEKYKSIRMANPKFSEKVLNIKGALEFLLAAGFRKITQGELEESYLVFDSDCRNSLKDLIDSLLDINGIELQLDRDFRVVHSKDLARYESISVSSDFYELSSLELKNEQLLRTKEIEEAKLLKTKKMRELDNAKRSKRKPLYTRIRIRLPNELIIEGTFSVGEKFKNLRMFIDEVLEIDSNYTLTCPPAYVYNENDEEKTFAELDLQPAVNLILKTPSKTISFKK